MTRGLRDYSSLLGSTCRTVTDDSYFVRRVRKLQYGAMEQFQGGSLVADENGCIDPDPPITTKFLCSCSAFYGAGQSN